MANNGRTFQGNCLPESQYALNFCLQQYPSHTNHIGAFWSDGTIQCRLKNPEIYPAHISKAPDCELTPTTSTPSEQIEAVNAVFAAVLVALCVIWGVKMVYNTLISNPRGE